MLAAIGIVATCGPATSPAPGSGGVSATTAAPTLDPSSPAGRLAAALDAFTAGYTFESSVAIAGKAVTGASGRWVGGSSEATVTSGGREVTYRVVGSQAWIQQSDGSWVLTDTPVPSGDPLQAFREPTAVTLVGEGATGLDLTATYAAATLGLTGEPVSVKVHVAADGSVTLTYATTIPAGAATSTTVLKPAAGLQPVPAPSPVGASPSG